ncbi:MAG: ABC transporter ATP-binding protein [Actinobacteria bacterium]|nr:ABC transporter ATP-binding protein [Actinomycetota bacterium]
MHVSDRDRAPTVELRGITKRFPGVVANQDVDLLVESGEIHAVVGENGAGKSTLMKVIYGMQRPDEGTILINGEDVHFRSPKDAIEAGIGMVHQHFMLARNLTILENVILGAEPTVASVIRFSEARDRIRELAGGYGMALDPDRLVENLAVGERQRVEILKVLYRGARILILDEPTAVLVPQEVQGLFASLRGLKRQGVTVIFISHKLDEVLEVADTITVMRGGRTVAAVKPAEVTAHRLAELMVGSELPRPEIRESTVTETVALAVEGLSLRGDEGQEVLRDVSFRIHCGEVVGIAGVEGNGQSELIEAIMGIRAVEGGVVRLGERDITAWRTRSRRESGISYIPEDRHSRGLLLSAPLWENAMLGYQTRPPFSKGFWIDRQGARGRTSEVIDHFRVMAPSSEVSAHALSGGNQQKLIVGREMTSGPKVLIAAQPTRGIDVGAQAAVWEQIKQARGAGLGVLLVSADLEELIGLSDTLWVIYGGRLVAHVDPRTVTPEELGGFMTGAGAAEESA